MLINLCIVILKERFARAKRGQRQKDLGLHFNLPQMNTDNCTKLFLFLMHSVWIQFFVGRLSKAVMQLIFDVYV